MLSTDQAGDALAFVEKIEEDIDNSAGLLVYADWLEESGEQYRSQIVRLIAKRMDMTLPNAAYCPKCGWAFNICKEHKNLHPDFFKVCDSIEAVCLNLYGQFGTEVDEDPLIPRVRWCKDVATGRGLRSWEEWNQKEKVQS